LPRQSQITLHNCIQGWTGIAEWTGVPITALLQLCGPRPEAKYIVFTSYQLGRESYPDAPNEALDRPYYEVLDIKEAKLPQTLLAYEMNGEPLSLEHGAPVRLRAETLLGFKMVKYLRSIELVADYRTIWEGQGGFREDVQFYSMTAQI
jgi:sulfoxide reductase catalytic subunit YedY